MNKMDLKKYGITGVTEIVYNPSYDELFREETKKGLRGFEKGQETEMGAVNVMTGKRMLRLEIRRDGKLKNASVPLICQLRVRV